MKKRILATALATVMVAGTMLAGCGPKEEAPAASTDTATEEKTEEAAAPEESEGGYVIGFSNASVSNGWRVKMRDMLMEAADELGVTIVESDANDNADTQNANIEAMLQKDLDAILITPCVEEAVNPGIEAAFAKGIPVILFDRSATTEDYTHYA